ncbi:MAG: hypothetical protein U0931_40220 [Vulcanimicrobiota bacterium]
MTNKLQDLYETHILMGMRKQRHLGELLGQHSWQYDKASGTMAFPPGPTYQVQVLGTEAAESDSWLWAWANTASAFPPEQLKAANQLRALGQEWGIEEWTTPSVPREKLPAHTLAPIVLGVLGLPAYYRGAMGPTNLLVVIDDPKFSHPASLKGTDFVATLGDAISNCAIPNHRLAVEKFVEQLGWTPQWQEQTLEVAANDGVRVICRFDDMNRLAKLSTRVPAGA